jgi:sigma-E factor negative regulatory protein RseB
MRAATHSVNYVGTFAVSSDKHVQNYRIAHLREGKNVFEKLETSDGSQSETIRVNDEVVYYFPEGRFLLLEKSSSISLFPKVITGDPIWLSDFYTIASGNVERVAGLSCQTIRLQPKDRLRHGYEFCAEPISGLPLSIKTLDDNQQVIEQIAFSSIAIGKVAKRSVRPSITGTRGWEKRRIDHLDVDTGNWHFKGLPAGFKRHQENRSPMIDALVHSLQKQERPISYADTVRVEQVVFSDGLASVSILIEKWGEQVRSEPEIQHGARNRLGKRVGEFWLTISGEVPAVTMRQIAQSIDIRNR